MPICYIQKNISYIQRFEKEQLFQTFNRDSNQGQVTENMPISSKTIHKDQNQKYEYLFFSYIYFPSDPRIKDLQR